MIQIFVTLAAFGVAVVLFGKLWAWASREPKRARRFWEEE